MGFFKRIKCRPDPKVNPVGLGSAPQGHHENLKQLAQTIAYQDTQRKKQGQHYEPIICLIPNLAPPAREEPQRNRGASDWETDGIGCNNVRDLSVRGMLFLIKDLSWGWYGGHRYRDVNDKVLGGQFSMN